MKILHRTRRLKERDIELIQEKCTVLTFANEGLNRVSTPPMSLRLRRTWRTRSDMSSWRSNVCCSRSRCLRWRLPSDRPLGRYGQRRRTYPSNSARVSAIRRTRSGYRAAVPGIPSAGTYMVRSSNGRAGKLDASGRRQRQAHWRHLPIGNDLDVCCSQVPESQRCRNPAYWVSGVRSRKALEFGQYSQTHIIGKLTRDDGDDLIRNS